MSEFCLEVYSKTRLLGFDQDSKVVAWAFLEGGRYKGGNLYRADPERNVLWIERLPRIRAFLLQIIKDWRPEVVVFEMPMGEHGNPLTNRILGAALGVSLGAAWQLSETRKHKGLTVLTVTPQEAQNTGIWGKTELGMAAALQVVAPRPGLSEHEADALGVALAGWANYLDAEMLEAASQGGE